jgi:hypothetical protein
VPDQYRPRVWHELHRTSRIRAEARLRGRSDRRVACEAEDGEDDRRQPRRLLRALQLDDARRIRHAFTGPRHPHAHGVGAELALPAHDGRGLRRPLQRVVVDADEEAWPHVRGPQQPDGQSDRKNKPRSDCRTTRHPVAHTVRR